MEGFWINYDSGKTFPVDEHETWIRKPVNAKKIGLSSGLFKMFDKYKYQKDRDDFLVFIMSKAPIMRVRGHGSYWTFEFYSSKIDDILFEIYKFAKGIAGDYTGMNIVNMKNKDVAQIYFKDFKEKIKDGDTESIMKVAKKEKK